jgi:acyl carrier protein
MTERDDAVRRIDGIIQSLDSTPPGLAGTVTAETSVLGDLALDSVATMDFIMAVETEFDVVIPIDRMSDISTVGDLADAVLAMHAPAVA